MSTPSDPWRGPAADHHSEEPEELAESSGGRYADPAERSFSLYPQHSGATTTRELAAQTPRPPEMWAGAVFLTLAVLPLLFLGVGLALQLGQFGPTLRQQITSAGTKVNADTLILLFRVGGTVLAALAVLLIVLAWLATRPSRGARTGAAALAALVAAGMILTVVVSTPDPVSIGILLLAVAGAILLFLPRSQEFLAARR